MMKVSELKSDKTDVSSMKTFMMNSLSNNPGEFNLDGLDQNEKLIKKINKIEQSIDNLVTREEKIYLDKDIKELKNNIDHIQNHKITPVENSLIK